MAEGTFQPALGPVEFRVVRDGAQVYVVDPDGLVTTATDASVAEVVGRFASWGLQEAGPELTPAVIESVWAG